MLVFNGLAKRRMPFGLILLLKTGLYGYIQKNIIFGIGLYIHNLFCA